MTTTEEDFIDFKCPQCGDAVSFPLADVGLVRECPNCFGDVIVPQTGNELGGALPLPVTSNRVQLRRFTPNDWKDLLELASGDDTYVDGMPGASEEAVLHWLESDGHIRLLTPGQIFHLAIVVQDSGKLIGYAGIWFTDADHRQARFNISLHPAHRRQGIGLEAADALLGFCFEGIKLHRVSARCDSNDAVTCRLLESLGLRREGEFVKDQPLADGGWANSVWYAALEEEYLEAPKTPDAA